MSFNKSQRPWWREPVGIGLIAVISLASAAVLSKGYFAPSPVVDPRKPVPLPGGSSFCEVPTPAQSTAFNPSSRKSK